MSTSTANIRVGGTLTGGISWAALGTTAPVTPTASLAAGYKDLGGLTDDGVVKTPTTSTSDIRLRDGSLGRRIISQSETTFQFTCVETNENTFSVFFPGSTYTPGSVAVKTVNSPVSNPLSWVIDELDNGIHTRTVIPRGEVTDFGAVTIAISGAKAYQMTLAAYPSSAGLVYLEYTDDPAFLT